MHSNSHSYTTLIDMLASVQAFLQKHCAPQFPLLLACSGGLDSMVLAHLLLKAGHPFAVAHVNFQLRGADSEGDEAFVREWAEANAVSCFVKVVNTKAEAAERGQSTQLAARDIRYEWLKSLKEEGGYAYILMGHHLNDTLETSLFHLAKGGGIAGVSGIPPVTDDVLRPLISFSRSEISAYASKHELSWREDISNQSTDYNRNKIRHEIVPRLRELNPNLERTATATFERLRSTHRLLKEIALRCWSQGRSIPNGGWLVPIKAFMEWEERAIILHESLRAYGFNYFQAEQIGEALPHANGQCFLSSTHELYLSRLGLQLLPLGKAAFLGANTKPLAAISEPSGSFNLGTGVLSWKLLSEKPRYFKPPTEAAYFDRDALVLPLELRLCREGDRIQPFGMKGHKLVSDLQMEARLSPLQKKNTVLICNKGEPIWAIGLRTSQKASVTPRTTQFLCFCWVPAE